MKHLDDIGEADNTIVIFTTDNGAEVFTWPDGGMTPFRATAGGGPDDHLLTTVETNTVIMTAP